MRKKIVIMGAGVTLTILSVMILFSYSHQPNRSGNGFVRVYQRVIPELLFKTKVNYKIRNFAGLTDSSFFIGAIDSLMFCEFSLTGKEMRCYRMRFPAIIHHPIFNVEDTGVYLIDGDGKTIFHKHITAQEFAIEKIPGQVFTKFLMIRPGKYVLLQFIDGVRDQRLVLYDSKTNKITGSDSLTKLNYDNGMAEEGKLYQDRENQHVVFVFNKKNSFMLLDTNLRLLNRGNTIDTITSVVEKVKNFKRNKGFFVTNAMPTLVYNKASAVSKGILYNYSKLKADNEKASDFSSFCNIDMYDLSSSKYLGSFYLPKLENQEIRSMRVHERILYVGYQNHVAAFNLN